MRWVLAKRRLVSSDKWNRTTRTLQNDARRERNECGPVSLKEPPRSLRGLGGHPCPTEPTAIRDVKSRCWWAGPMSLPKDQQSAKGHEQSLRLRRLLTT